MLNRLAHIFTRPFPYANKMSFFKRVLYIFLFINTLTLLPIAEELFGYYGIVGSGGWNTITPWYAQGSRALVNVLSHPINGTYTWIYWVFIIGQLIGLTLGLLGVWRRLAALMVYFFTVNLFLKGYLMFTGGEALINILLFYLIFINETADTKSCNYKIQNVLNNTFFVIMLIQICVLYFFSTLYKLIDPYWLSGEAMMYISRVDAFSGDMMRNLFAENPMISKLATWSVLAYQGLFSILVWIRKVKIPLLVIGVMFHLSISFFMGIFAFGVIMTITYILFLEDKHIERFNNWFSRRKKLALETNHTD